MSKSTFYAFLGGAIAGGVLGLLFAPYEGKEMRRRIKEMVRRKCPACADDELEAIVEQITAEVMQQR